MTIDSDKKLSAEQIEAIERDVREAATEERHDDILSIVQPLVATMTHQEESAVALLDIIENQFVPKEIGLELIGKIDKAHSGSTNILALIGYALEGVRDIDRLNLAAPEDPVYESVVTRLEALLATELSDNERFRVLGGLATATRMSARQYDDLSQFAHKRMAELDDQNSARHYTYGLFLKTRGFFAEGRVKNELARSLSEETVDSYEWNLGICATGAHEGEAALEVWERMGQKIRMGRFGLPEGGYPACKVRLAERPLAERSKDTDDPGSEETIWIDRLSPCHGIIQSVLFNDLGVDYGDVVLFDGAPITYHRYGDDDIPVFPHLATLLRNDYQFYDFAGTQAEKNQIYDASSDLADDAIIYSHTENFRNLCAGCWSNTTIDHTHTDDVEKHIVTGRIAAPPSITPGELLEQLDAALAGRSPCKVYSPTLCEAAGDTARAKTERRRFDLIYPRE